MHTAIALGLMWGLVAAVASSPQYLFHEIHEHLNFCREAPATRPEGKDGLGLRKFSQ